MNDIWSRLWTAFHTGIAGSQFTLAQLLIVLVLLTVLVWITGRLTRWLSHWLVHHHGLDVGVTQAIGTIFRYAIIALGVVLILQGVGINLSALNVLIGALGVGLGFGLQNITNNFVSGLIILFERPVKVGDRVEVGGVAGNVDRIGARATTIVTNDNIAIIVPNSQFIAEQVTNWSYTSALVRIHVPVGVSYEADPAEVRRILLDVASRNTGVLTDPPPDVLFTEFGDSSLNFALRVWTSQFTRVPTVLQSQLNFEIWNAFKAADVEIPFPQRDLHVRSGRVEVEMVGKRGGGKAGRTGEEGTDGGETERGR